MIFFHQFILTIRDMNDVKRPYVTVAPKSYLAAFRITKGANKTAQALTSITFFLT